MNLKKKKLISYIQIKMQIILKLFKMKFLLHKSIIIYKHKRFLLNIYLKNLVIVVQRFFVIKKDQTYYNYKQMIHNNISKFYKIKKISVKYKCNLKQIIYRQLYRQHKHNHSYNLSLIHLILIQSLIKQMIINIIHLK